MSENELPKVAPQAPVQSAEDAKANVEPENVTHHDQVKAMRDVKVEDPTGFEKEIADLTAQFEGEAMKADPTVPPSAEEIERLQAIKRKLEDAMQNSDRPLLTRVEAAAFVADIQRGIQEIGMKVNSTFPPELRASFVALERLDEAFMWMSAAAHQFTKQDEE